MSSTSCSSPAEIATPQRGSFATCSSGAAVSHTASSRIASRATAPLTGSSCRPLSTTPSRRQQPGRSLPPADASPRAPHAALQIGGTGPTVPRGPRRRAQPVHRWTASASRRPSATSALACVRYMECRGSGLTRSAPRQRPTGAAVGINLTVPGEPATIAADARRDLPDGRRH